MGGEVPSLLSSRKAWRPKAGLVRIAFSTRNVIIRIQLAFTALDMKVVFFMVEAHSKFYSHRAFELAFYGKPWPWRLVNNRKKR